MYRATDELPSSTSVGTSLERTDYEILDLSGDGSGLIMSEAAKTVIESLAIDGLPLIPSTLGFTNYEAPLFFGNISNEHPGLVDFDNSKILDVDSCSYIDIIKSIRFSSDALAALPESKLDVFRLKERFTTLFLSERIATALTDSKLTGFKCYPLEEWFQGISQEDEYLNPWAFQ